MDKLRKENEKLRTDLQATKEEVEKLSKLVTCKSQDGASSRPLSPGQIKSVDLISSPSAANKSCFRSKHHDC